MDYRRSSHSKNCLIIHVIFVVKYRKSILTIFGDEVKQLIRDISKEADLNILEIEVDKDHIHVLIKYPPRLSVSSIVKQLKQLTTHRVWRTKGNRDILRKCFWKENTFWSDGYFVASIGNASYQTIQEYIKNQG